MKSALLDRFGWNVFDRPPYSPDSGPSDFRLFHSVKKRRPGTQRFGERRRVGVDADQRLNEQAAEFCSVGIEKRLYRYDKCLNVGGHYVEK